jgi:predicted SAM-dependent methyltransferase
VKKIMWFLIGRYLSRKRILRLGTLYVKFRYLLLFPLYVGDKYYCPFCGGRFRRMLSGGLDVPVLKEMKVVGAGYRANAICPCCRSTDRERLLYVYLKNKRGIDTNGLKLLHVAPERNLQKALMGYPNIDYVGGDLALPLGDQHWVISIMIRMDITKIPCRDSVFDAILCSHVLEHVPDDRTAVSELYRVLKPGGWGILQVPISRCLERTYEDIQIKTTKEREESFGQADHVRIYGLDWADRLKSAGFRVSEYNYADEDGESETSRYGLSKDEQIYVCAKPQNVKENE